MLPFRNILFPVDYSDPCVGIVPYVRDMASHSSAKLTLYHAYHLGSLASAEVNLVEPDLLFEARDFEARQLQEFGEKHFPGLRVETCAQDAEAGSGIHELVDRAGIDLVMLPTHGRGPLRRLLLGSVTAKVLHDVRATVWTGVGSTLAGHAPSIPYRSIVCALGDGDESEGVLKAAAEVAKAYEAELSLIHVVELPPTSWEVDLSPYLDELKESARVKLTGLAKKLNVDAPVTIVTSATAEGVHDEAVSRKADLIVTGRGHAHDGIGRVWSRLYAIVRAAPCPVMSV